MTTHFELEQRFAAPVEAVEEAFLEPALFLRLSALPGVGGPELLDQERDGDIVRQRLRYEFAGHLSAAARAVIDPRRLSWVEESVYDRRTHRVDVRIVPEHYGDHFHCEATVVFVDLGAIDGRAGGTRRTTDGEMTVRVPLVGDKVEQGIVSGLRDHARAEEQVVQAWLDERTGESTGEHNGGRGDGSPPA